MAKLPGISGPWPLWPIENVTELVPAPERVVGHNDELHNLAHAAALDEAAVAIGVEIAGNAPLSVRGNKRLLRALLTASHAIPPELEEDLLQQRRDCFQSDDFLEGVNAFAERRKPNWQGK